LSLGFAAQQGFLLRKRLILLLKITTPPLVLVERNDGPQVSLGQAVALLLQAEPGFVEVLAARLQFLRCRTRLFSPQ
jgi:hypothetical protein